MKCPQCKKTIEEDSEFCIYCGSKVEPYAGEIKKKNKLPIIVAGILGVCILITSVCFVLLFINRDQSETENNMVAGEVEMQGSKEETESNSESQSVTNESQKNQSETAGKMTDKIVNSMPEKNTEESQNASENANSSEYILPDSSQRILSDSEVSGLSKEDLRLARNEIYARHGRKFDDQELQNYFNSKSWYTGSIDPSNFSESLLSSIEKANIDTIKKYEK